MRTVWRGAISVGLVSIGVRLYAATEDHDFRFHHVHRADGGRIRYRRLCSLCGAEVEYADVVKGYELDDGRMVLLDKADLDALPSLSGRAMEVVRFVPADEVHPIYFQRAYYLEPQPQATQAYLVLRQAMERTHRVAVVKIALRRREILAVLHTKGALLMLHTLWWRDEIREPDFEFLDRPVSVRPAELEMAISLVTAMSGPFSPQEHSDEYRDAVAELIEARSADARPQPIPPQRAGDNGMDLLTALERSLDRARADIEPN